MTQLSDAYIKGSPGLYGLKNNHWHKTNAAVNTFNQVMYMFEFHFSNINAWFHK